MATLIADRLVDVSTRLERAIIHRSKSQFTLHLLLGAPLGLLAGGGPAVFLAPIWGVFAGACFLAVWLKLCLWLEDAPPLWYLRRLVRREAPHFGALYVPAIPGPAWGGDATWHLADGRVVAEASAHDRARLAISLAEAQAPTRSDIARRWPEAEAPAIAQVGPWRFLLETATHRRILALTRRADPLPDTAQTDRYGRTPLFS